jgi:UDP-glucuronate 4-epimerase
MQVLITGVAGFVGYHLAYRLLEEGIHVYGIDNLNDYYDVSLKKDRLSQFSDRDGFKFRFLDLCDRDGMKQLFETHQFDVVINLAAQAGVRYSISNPHAYIDSNLVGFVNVLEGCRHQQVPHLIYASSSSVYGANRKIPFATDDCVDHPISLYAATKKANELIAHTYSHLFGLPTTGLRFFKFAQAIDQEQPIDVYNFGEMQRDFTYVDDVVEGIVRLLKHPPEKRSSQSEAPYKVYNIGNNTPVSLMEFIQSIESALGKKATLNFLPMQPGDVPITFADVDDLVQDVGFQPKTSIQNGITQFVRWYRSYYL